MNIDIIVVYMQRYQHGHEMNFVPPITGIHLAAITPARHRVRVVHQQIDPIDYDSDADLIALSFFSGFTPEARRLAQAFRQRGKIVVTGGPHASFWPQEVLEWSDAVVVGEAESVWPQLLEDAERGFHNPRLGVPGHEGRAAEAGRMGRVYRGKPTPLHGLPTPRYDLLPGAFFVPRVVQATRGCPFTCSFCTVPSLNPGFRTRPVEDMLHDITYDSFSHWWQKLS
jgi:radical SAM superfamily enzyme YgiQ (UPF0313 family)